MFWTPDSVLLDEKPYIKADYYILSFDRCLDLLECYKVIMPKEICVYGGHSDCPSCSMGQYDTLDNPAGNVSQQDRYQVAVEMDSFRYTENILVVVGAGMSKVDSAYKTS